MASAEASKRLRCHCCSPCSTALLPISRSFCNSSDLLFSESVCSKRSQSSRTTVFGCVRPWSWPRALLLYLSVTHTASRLLTNSAGCRGTNRVPGVEESGVHRPHQRKATSLTLKPTSREQCGSREKVDYSRGKVDHIWIGQCHLSNTEYMRLLLHRARVVHQVPQKRLVVAITV